MALGLAILGLLDLVDGHSQLRGGIVFVALFVLLVVLVRRNEPSSDL